MAVENDFLTFAAASGANVLTQSAYAAAAATATGFQTGTASSAAVNKTLRQSSIMSAMIASFIVANTNQTVIDDGTTATIQANFQAAILSITAGITITIPMVQGLTAALNGKLSTTGNAASASKLNSPVNIALGGVVTGNVNFDGSSEVIITTSWGGTFSPSNYLPIAGGTVTGNLTVNGTFAASGISLAGTQGLQILWNTLTPGNGRLEYVNNHGLGAGGHYWYDRSAPSNTAVNTMNLTAAGNLTVLPNASSPPNGVGSFGFIGSGSYGGGFGLIDGTYNIGMYSSGGWLNFGFGTSLGALTSKASIDTGGNFVSQGNVTAIGAVYAGQYFTSSSTSALLSASSSGGQVVLRPNGPGTTTGQASINSAGNLVIAGSFSTPFNVAASGTIASGNQVSGNTLLASGSATPGTQGHYIQWNETGGTGEADIINNHGGGVGGWNWYDTSGSGGTLTKAMSLTAAGALTIPGAMVATGGFQSSDIRLKTHIQKRAVQRGFGLSIARIFCEWDRIADGVHDVGLVAQRVRAIAPRYVIQSPSTGMLAIDKAGIALEAGMDNALHLREHDKAISRLQNRIEKLETAR